jgi:putative FmdB family regulatory protein
MPTYEYLCKNCGETIEVFQSFSDKPLKKHRECGGQLQKVFHARGIVFKGGGFYATDSKPAAKTESSESSTDSKPKKSEKSEKAGATASTSSSDD